MNNSPQFHLHAIQSIHDPLLLPWLDLYEMAFPPEERMLVSRYLSLLSDPNRTPERQVLAVMDGGGRLVGLADLYQPAHVEAAFLWYFAVVPQARGQGLGSQVYRHLLASLRPDARAMIFDLEDPAAQPDPPRQALARRRIEFYRRHGARLLSGIRYLQRVSDFHPPLHLHIMVQPVAQVSPQEAFSLAAAVLGEAIHQAGELVWA